MQYLFNKIRLVSNIIKYTIIKPKETTVLDKNTGKVWEDCKHEYTVEVITKYPVSRCLETYVYCKDCNKTLFDGWRPIIDEDTDEEKDL